MLLRITTLITILVAFAAIYALINRAFMPAGVLALVTLMYGSIGTNWGRITICRLIGSNWGISSWTKKGRPKGPKSYLAKLRIANKAEAVAKAAKYISKSYPAKLLIAKKAESDAREVEGIIIELEPGNESIDEMLFVISNKSERTFRNLEIFYGTLFSISMRNIDPTHMRPYPKPDPPIEIANFPPGSRTIFAKKVPGIMDSYDAYEKEAAYLQYTDNDHRYQESDKMWCWINIRLPGVKEIFDPRLWGYP